MSFIYKFGLFLTSVGYAAGDYYTKFEGNCDPSVNILSTRVASLTSCALICDIQDSCLTISFKQDTFVCNIHDYSSANCPTSSDLDWVRFQREGTVAPVSTDSPTTSSALTPSLGAECSFNTTSPIVGLKSRCGEDYIKSPLILKLQVCNYARVNLEATAGEQYLVDIGSTMSFIRFISGPTSNDHPTIYDPMTSCNEARWFWITWTQVNGDTTINVGTGFQVGSNIFMTRTDVWSMVFTDAVISTMGGNTGYWTFYEQ